jgi:hypothetical protein
MSSQLTSVGSAKSATKSPWPALVVALTVSGAVPALWNLTLLEGLHRSAYLIGYFALSVFLPLIAGLLVTSLLSRVHPAEIVLAALGAGALEAVSVLAVIPHVTIKGSYLVVDPEDYMAWGAIFCMFAAGGLYRLTRYRRHSEHKENGPADPGKIRHRDVLLFSTRLLGVIGPLIGLYKVFAIYAIYKRL